MSSESFLLIALVVLCVAALIVAMVWSLVREARPGTRRYRNIVRELRQWGVLEPREPANTERVRELVQNWTRLSRPGKLATVVDILIFILVAGGLFFGPPLIRPRPLVVAAPVDIALAFGFLASIFLAKLRASSRAQIPEAFIGAFPHYRLYTAGIRPIFCLTVGTVAVIGALTLSALTGVFPATYDSSEWETVRSHPWLALVIPVALLAMLVFCLIFIRRLSRLRPLRLAEDDPLSLRASVAFLQMEVNHLHYLLAYLVACGVVQQFSLLPDFGNFSIIFDLAASALLLYAIIQPFIARSTTLPPPELFMPTSETMR